MSYLVIDVGTSGCRAAVVTREGEIQSQSRRPFNIERSRPGFAEIDVDRLWPVVRKVIVSEVEKHPGIAFDAVGVSALLAYVFLDKAGRPLMPAISYEDNRAALETREIQDLFPEEKFLAVTGRKPSPMLLAPKIRWLAKHRPAVVEKISCIIGLKDDIVGRLSGNILTDVAHLDYSGLYNIYQKKIEADLLEALGIRENIFPDPAPATAIAGTITAGAARETGLIHGTPVVVGSSDGTTAMYGGGVLEEGTAVLVSGTTDVLMTACAAAPPDVSDALCVNSGLLPGVFLIGGPLGLSGGTLQYFERLLQASADQRQEKMAILPPGSNGLLVMPGLTGERAPFWQEHVSGSVTGLTPNHQSEHILRAVLEGCALRIKSLLRILVQNGSVPRALNVVGGGANRDVWNRIRADALDLEVRKLAVTEATCLGAALFCKTGLDPTRSLKENTREWLKVDKRFFPNQRHVRIYEQLHRLFEAHILANSGLYQDLDKLRQMPQKGSQLSSAKANGVGFKG